MPPATVAEPGDALQIGIDDEERDRHGPEPADEWIELEDRDEEDRERDAAQAHDLRARERPAGSSRAAVRGLRVEPRRRSAGSSPSPASVPRPSPR